MVKKRGKVSNTDLFSSTEQDRPASEEIPAEGRTLSIGVGLKESEVQMLDTIAKQLGIARNGLMRYGLRYFLKEYAAGRIDLLSDVETPQPKKRLNMP